MRSFNLEDIQLEHQKTQLCGIACQSHNSTKLPALIDSTHTLCSPRSQRMVWKAFVWWIQSSESDKLQSNQAVMGDREKRSNQKLEMLTEMGGNLTPGDGDGADDLTTCFSYFCASCQRGNVLDLHTDKPRTYPGDVGPKQRREHGLGAQWYIQDMCEASRNRAGNSCGYENGPIIGDLPIKDGGFS